MPDLCRYPESVHGMQEICNVLSVDKELNMGEKYILSALDFRGDTRHI